MFSIIWSHLRERLGWRAFPFLLATLAKTPAYRREISSPEDDEGLAAVKGRLALLGLLHRRLTPLLGETPSRQTVVELSERIAVHVQRSTFMRGGRQSSWDQFHARHEHEMQTGPYRYNEHTPIEDDGNTYRYAMQRCLFHEAFRAMGIGEATEGFCRSDEIVYNQCARGMSFHRGPHEPNTLARGADQCEFTFQRRS